MMDEPTYAEGLSDGRDEIYQLIFDILADEREWCLARAKTDTVNIIDRISARLDAYVDEMRGVWNAH